MQPRVAVFAGFLKKDQSVEKFRKKCCFGFVFLTRGKMKMGYEQLVRCGAERPLMSAMAAIDLIDYYCTSSYNTFTN
jgi:hypothetical protein